jgi:hypothetical protein
MTSVERERCQELTPLERPRFFSGQMLTARDFQDEQSYHRGKGQQHHRYLHGVGVVCGLRVRPAGPGRPRTVVVEPGLAVDAWGREIVVPEPVAIDLDAWDEPRRAPALFVALEYRALPTELVPVLGPEGEAVPSRIREGFGLSLRREPPAGEDWASRELCARLSEVVREGGSAEGLHAFVAAWVSQPCRPCAPDPGVTLARIDLPTTGPITAAKIDNWSYRPVALSTGQMLQLLLCALAALGR